MTVPPIPNDEPTVAVVPSRRRRRLALIAVLGLIIVAALLTPEMIRGRGGDDRLTSYSASAQGARLLFELTKRLGWEVTRWTSVGVPEPDSRTIVAVLDPAQPVGAIESHDLLRGVRAGGALLYVMSGSSPLNDSLHVRRSLIGGIYEPAAAGVADAPLAGAGLDSVRARRLSASTASDSADQEDADTSAECAHAAAGGGALPMWPDETVRLWRLQFNRVRPPAMVVFARSRDEAPVRDTTRAPSMLAAAGFPLGRGRVVIIADPDLLRNDVLRVCKWGLDVVAVRMLEYLAGGESSRNHLVFDEYHQGYGTHPGTLRAIVVFLSRSSSGHVLLQCMFAGLVLLLALGPRPLPVQDAERIERRSPLEHVTALARAYARVGGTRTATARLLRGVRRRVDRGAPNESGRSADDRDRQFLDVVAATPALADDAAVIRRALAEPVTRHEFTTVGAALTHVEQSLLTARR